ncbi:MAG: nucleoside phosphorylase-I family protein [Saccharofermentanales bacterium]
MIFIAAALPCEAEPLIDRFELKRDAQEKKFRIYRNDRICLVITGVGGSAAMIAVTYLLAVNHAQKTDSLISFGISALFDDGAAFIDGRVYQGSAIRNMSLRRSFYPDMLYRLPFEEAEILTVSSIYRGRRDNEELERWPLPFIRTISIAAPRLVDMEAAYVYEAGCEFIYSHHIFILKVISDAGETGSVDNSYVKRLVAGHVDKLAGLIGILSDEECEPASDALIKKEFNSLVTAASAVLKLSFYQETELRNIAYNYNIRNNNLAEIIGMDAIGVLAAEAGLAVQTGKTGQTGQTEQERISSRKEGRILYERIRSRLLQP